MSATERMFAQCPSPNVTLNGTLTSASYNNQTIYISANATVPANVLVTFTDCSIYINQGVSITVQFAGNFEVYSNTGNNIITACDNNNNTTKEWWQGFVVNPGGGLVLSNNINTGATLTVSKCSTAVKSVTGTNAIAPKIQLFNTTFLNNRIGLLYSGYRQTGLDMAFVTTGCSFMGNEDYPGTDTEGGAHPALETGTNANFIPDMGCYFESLGTLSLTPSIFYFGNNNANTNYFQDLQTGIYITKSSFQIENCQFYRMLKTDINSNNINATIGGIGICNTVNNSITNGSAFRLTAIMQNNSFRNMAAVGIVCESYGYSWTPNVGTNDISADITIVNNNFINDADTYTSGGGTATFGLATTRGISFTSNKEISTTVSYNNITNFHTGVYAAANILYGSFRVRQNTIMNRDLINPLLMRIPNNSVGINIQASGGFRLDEGDLANNYIEGFNTSIYLSNIFMNDMPQNNVLYGFTTQTGLSCNQLYNAYGYRLEDCQMNTNNSQVQWDISDATVRCINQTLPNTNCSLTAFGIYFGSLVTGVQRAWIHDMKVENGNISMQFRGLCPLLNVTCNEFNNYGTGVSFLNFYSGVSYDITKTPYSMPNEPSDNRWNGSINNRITGSNSDVSNPITWWWRNNGNPVLNPNINLGLLGIDVFQSISPITTTDCPGPESGFREEELPLALKCNKMLGSADKLLKVKYLNTNYAQTIKTLTEQRIYHTLYSLYKGNNIDDVDYDALYYRLEHGNAYAMSKAQDALYHYALNDVLFYAALIKPTNTCEQLYQEALNIGATYILSLPEEIPQAVRARLKEIALLNKYEFGPAVSFARNLLQLQVDDEEVADTRLYENYFVSENTTIAVYPNPASEVLYIQAEGFTTSDELIVCDALGRVLITLTYNPGDTYLKLSLDDLASGCYTIRSINNNSVAKFIKQ